MAGDVAGAEAALQEAPRLRRAIRGAVSGLPICIASTARSLSSDGSGPAARAEACFLQAIEIARGQEARLLELRAATDLARLWRDAGSPNDPRALLEPILARSRAART